MIERNIFFIILFITASIQVNAQHKVYEQFTEKEGLPSNTVYDMVQDEKGYMLFATDNGLSKFDGTTFTTFSMTDGLPDNEILKLFKDSQDRIWLMGFNGEVGYMHRERFYNQDNTPFLKGLSFKNNVDLAYEDLSGNIWFHARNNKLHCLTPNSEVVMSDNYISGIHPKTFVEYKNKDLFLFSNFNKEQTHELRLNKKSIHVIVRPTENKDAKTLSTRVVEDLRAKGFYHNEDLLGMQFHDYFKKEMNGFNSFWPPKLYDESSNNVWVISNFTGLHLLSNTDSRIHSIFSRKDFAACSYFKDTEGNEWISSINDGVLFFPKTNINIINFKSTNDLQVIFQSKDSGIYFGDYFGSIYMLDENDQPERIFSNRQTKFSRSVSNKIYDIVEYKGHIISIHNSDIRIYERHDETFTGRYAVLSIATGKKGFVDDNNLYLATSNRVYKILLDRLLEHANWSDSEVFRFTQKNDEIPNNFYRKVIWKNRASAILMDDNKRLWVGTNKGLFYVENDNIISYSSPTDFKKCNITDIKETTCGTILVATNGYGLGVIKEETSYFINKIGEEFNPVINSVTIDKNGFIWLATNTGLSAFVLEDSNLISQKQYTPLEGLSSKNISRLVVNETKIYATSSNGLNIINREQTTDESSKHVPIYLNNVFINEFPNDSFNIKKLKHHQNDLHFTYSGVSFRSGRSIKYNYRLQPWETEWIATNNKEVRYSNLPPNDYTFEVKAIDKDGIESISPAMLSFSINGAWYNNTILKILAIGLTVLLAWYLISNRVASIRTRSAYNEKIVVLKHQALLAQMNPHFIYNSLSSIQQFILSHDTDQAQKQLTRFASLIRAILANSKRATITLKEEINLIESYLELESIRFNNFFSYDIDLNVKDPYHIEILPMIIQPIVENAIIHGISTLSDQKRGKIHILITDKEDYVECVVTDNGIGINTSLKLKEKSLLKTESLALSNIKERLILYKDTQANIDAIELYDQDGQVIGTRVTVLIPILNYL